jgi:hypothetical protein
MEPSDYYDAPINKVLHFIRNVGLIKGQSKEKHNRSLKVKVQGPDFMAHPLYIHTYMLLADFGSVRFVSMKVWFMDRFK